MALLNKGDKLYVNSSVILNIEGEDVLGGWATIKEITIDESLSSEDVTNTLVTFEELPGHRYYYKILLEEQNKLSKRYKNRQASIDLDIN